MPSAASQQQRPLQSGRVGWAGWALSLGVCCGARCKAGWLAGLSQRVGWGARLQNWLVGWAGCASFRESAVGRVASRVGWLGWRWVSTATRVAQPVSARWLHAPAAERVAKQAG